MKKETTKTDVKFLVHPANGDLMAYFPKVAHSSNGYRNDLKTCYSHVGQHSSCAVEYAKECRKATKAERQTLINELEGLGYNLNILN